MCIQISSVSCSFGHVSGRNLPVVNNRKFNSNWLIKGDLLIHRTEGTVISDMIQSGL